MLHIDIPTLEEFKALAQVKGDTCVSQGNRVKISVTKG
jgi:hypothetical protein